MKSATAAAPVRAPLFQGARPSGNAPGPSGTLHHSRITLAGQPVRIAWREYGNPQSDNVIFCVHGLSRNSEDFDELAKSLTRKQDCRVICPDVVGRGDSDWFEQDRKNLLEQAADISRTNSRYFFRHLGAMTRNPGLYPTEFWHIAGAYRWEWTNSANPSRYNFNTYAEQMNQLMAHPDLHLDGKKVTWIGTSMGGLIGIQLAGQANSPIKRLVLNDVGPEANIQGLRDLARMAKGEHYPSYKDIDAVKADFRQRFKSFGQLSEADWDKVAKASVGEKGPDGLYHLRFDPKIINPLRWYKTMESLVPGFAQRPVDLWMDLWSPLMSNLVNLWHAWDRVQAPTLILRGEESNILARKTLDRMLKSHPGATAIEIPEIGHAPSLLPPDQLKLIQDWLRQHPV